MTAANTPRCFEEFIGQRVTGLLIDAIPVSRADLRQGTKTLIFEDGRGLTIASNGSYWVDSSDDVQAAVRETRRKVEATQHHLAGVLELAGER